MKTLIVFTFIAASVALSNAQCLNCNGSQTFPCSIDYIQYDPVGVDLSVSGLPAGTYAPGKTAYVGLGEWETLSYNAGRLQVSPPGILVPYDGFSSYLITAPNSIWFIAPRSNQNFTWVPSQKAQSVPNAVDFGSKIGGGAYYFGRIQTNTTVFVGIVPVFMGEFFYANNDGGADYTDTGYEVLTCTSPIEDLPATSPPDIFTPIPNADKGCIHKWSAYNNDNEPVTKGVSVGDYDCGNTGFVGKANPEGPWRPGRIQTTGNSGAYVLNRGVEVFVANGSKYLVDNPSYTYRWVTYKDSLPSNTVFARNDVGSLAFAVTRVRTDGSFQVGYYIGGREAVFPTSSGQGFMRYYEVLTCDPIPRFKCGAQTWNKYSLDSAPATDGVKAGTYQGNDVFVGRGTRKCANGCSFNIGRIQTSPASAAGVYYSDDLSGSVVFDTTTAEYLVGNSNWTYSWTSSSNGVRVENAVELNNNGSPVYVGVTLIDQNYFVGTVVPRKGLFYVDTNGKRSVTSSYGVLTCSSPTKI